MAEYYTEGEIGKLTISVPVAEAVTFELIPDAKFQIVDKYKNERIIFLCGENDDARYIAKGSLKGFSIDTKLPVDPNLLLQAKNFHNKVRVYTGDPKSDSVLCSKLEFI